MLMKSRAGKFFGGNFQTRAHDGNKAAGLKVTTWDGVLEEVGTENVLLTVYPIQVKVSPPPLNIFCLGTSL